MEPALFRSVPQKDFFHLLPQGQPDGKKIVDLLRYKKEDVSTAANISLSSVRYDQKMPEELRKRLIEWAMAINLVADFFGDGEKAILWFQTPNPLLGSMTPRDMIRVGRFKKLFKFIQTALEENRR